MDILQLEERLDTFLAGLGFELVDFQVQTARHGRTFRLFVDRLDEGQLDIDLLSNLSKQIRLHLELNNIYDDNTLLEVSSPGLDRLLKRPKHFMRYKGSRVKLQFRATDGIKYAVNGTIMDANNEYVNLAMSKGEAIKSGFVVVNSVQNDKNPVVQLPFNSILLCRLMVEV